jgi:hypothetical protein
VAIRASGNVTSITDNGSGDYTINFTTAMPDANYSVQVTTGNDSASGPIAGLNTSTAAPSTTAVRVMCANDIAVRVDQAYYHAAIFR